MEEAQSEGAEGDTFVFVDDWSSSSDFSVCFFPLSIPQPSLPILSVGLVQAAQEIGLRTRTDRGRYPSRQSERFLAYGGNPDNHLSPSLYCCQGVNQWLEKFWK